MTTAPPISPATVTPAQLAPELNLKARTIRDMCARGEITAVRVGQLWRIPAAERDRLLGLTTA